MTWKPNASFQINKLPNEPINLSHSHPTLVLINTSSQMWKITAVLEDINLLVTDIFFKF